MMLVKVAAWHMSLKIALIAIAALMLLASGYLAMIRPQMIKLQQLHQKNVLLERHLQRQQRQLLTLPVYQAQLQTMQQQLMLHDVIVLQTIHGILCDKQQLWILMKKADNRIVYVKSDAMRRLKCPITILK